MRFTTRPLRIAAVALAAVLAMPAAPLLHDASALARPGPDSFADLAAKLLPGVVNISSSQLVTADASRGNRGPEVPIFPPGSPFEQFFKDFMDRNRPGGGQGAPNGGQRGDRAPTPNRPAPRSTALGSGFIIDPSGIVVTNNHVIEGADEITVILQDNTTMKATLIGRDERSDIAVLQVHSDKPLQSVAFGDSDHSRVGDWVLAIGNPFGLGGSVTAGIVSARGRNIDNGPYDNFIQTDAAINKGNSGGPLFNMDGEVIGINTAIYSPSGGSIGIGFSIPSNMAKTVVAQLRNFGHARRGWLGVRIQQVSPDIAESVGLKDASGAMIAGVNEGGPADKAKLKNGDIVLSFNGEDVKEMRNLPRIVAETDIGKAVPVVVWRDGKQVSLSATVGEMPDDQKVASVAPDKPAPTAPLEISGLGLKLSPITPDNRDKYSLGQDQKGVVITEVVPGSPAADRGLKAGDVIVEVQQQAVSAPGDVADRVNQVRKDKRKSVLLMLQSTDGMRFVPLSLEADADRKPG